VFFLLAPQTEAFIPDLVVKAPRLSSSSTAKMFRPSAPSSHSDSSIESDNDSESGDTVANPGSLSMPFDPPSVDGRPESSSGSGSINNDHLEVSDGDDEEAQSSRPSEATPARSENQDAQNYMPDEDVSIPPSPDISITALNTTDDDHDFPLSGVNNCDRPKLSGGNQGTPGDNAPAEDDPSEDEPEGPHESCEEPDDDQSNESRPTDSASAPDGEFSLTQEFTL
jgi:hypothetical protein